MALRLLEIVVAESRIEDIEGVLEDCAIVDRWRLECTDERAVVRVLLQAEVADDVLDRLTEAVDAEDLRLLLLPVEGARPHPETDDDDGNDEAEGARIGRDELYADLVSSARVTPVYLALVTLSTIVAAIGLLRSDVAVIIGAMVIAPLLGPNVALALATTLADAKLGVRSLLANAAGAGLALAISFAIGLLVHVDPESAEISRRTAVGLPDLGLALAAGGAGALAFTTGIASGIIGVMVAVALLPPLVACGLLLGQGHYRLAIAAGVLLTANLICVNLAGVVTFLVRGIRPFDWWEAERARKATIIAIGIWVALLAALVVGILLVR